MTPEQKQAAVLQNDEMVRSYKLAFGSPAGELVLKDLSRYCRAGARETCAVPGSPDRTFLLLGRNDVYRRIQWLMGMTPDELTAYNGGIAVQPDEQE